MAGPVIRMKTMMVAILDVSPSMADTIDTDTNAISLDSALSKMEIAKSFFGSFLLQRGIASKTAEYCLVTSGDDQTMNKLNAAAEGEGGYERINEVFPMRAFNQDMIETLHHLPVGSSPGDVIDGIVVGFDILHRSHVGKAYNKVMLIMTDGENENLLDGLDQILDSIKQDHCAVYCLLLGKITKNSSTFKTETAEVLKNFAHLTGGRYREAEDVADCIPLLTSAPGFSSKPRETRFMFEISPYMRIPCIIWNKTKTISLPSLAKAPTAASRQAIGLDGDTSRSSVKKETQYRHPADEDEEVDLLSRVKGYKYGAQYIPFRSDEEIEFQVPGKKGIFLVGFISAASVPRHHYMKTATVFEGDPDIESGVKSIRAIHTAMLRTKTVALVRFVNADNAEPYLGVLMPNVAEKDNRSSLILHRLPLADDVREYPFPSFNLNSLTPSQTDSCSNFVETMTIDKPLPSQMHPFNPTRLALMTEVQKKMLTTGDVQTDVASFHDPFQAANKGTVINFNIFQLR
jgi:ATP-dependent DNA helicase 2 subunit 2